MSRHKYLFDTHILHTHFKPDDSCIWRAIVKVVEILGACFICMVGRGQVSIWYDKWLDNVYLCNVVSYVHIRDTNFRLGDLVENGDWNFNKLYTQLPSFYQDCIHIITIDHDTEDRLIWIAYPNGQFSASYGYRWLNQNLTQQLEPVICWSWIWRLSISENLRHFCWLGMHASLPMNAFCGLRHFTSDTSCHRCGASVESDMHTLRDCPRAKNRHLCHTYPNNLYIQDCQIWFKHHVVRERGNMIISVCYGIWRNRNEEIFQNITKTTWASLTT